MPLHELALLCDEVHAEILRGMPPLSTLRDEFMERPTAHISVV
jgi:hypothetical protein